MVNSYAGASPVVLGLIPKVNLRTTGKSSKAGHASYSVSFQAATRSSAGNVNAFTISRSTTITR